MQGQWQGQEYWYLLLVLILGFILLTNKKIIQQGGAVDDDPYAGVRFWNIIDFFRTFWLTR